MTVTLTISTVEPGCETFSAKEDDKNKDIQKKQCSHKRYLAIGCAVVSFLIIVATTVLVIIRDNQVKEWEEHSKYYCMTSECRGLANSMMSSMNRSVSPCEDFYEYACGNWKLNNINKLNRTMWFTHQALYDRNLVTLNDIVNRPRSWFNTSVELKVKDYYTSCVDDNRLINQAGAQPLIDLINSLNWGVNISRWNTNWDLPDDWDLTKQMAGLQKLNVASFIRVTVLKNPDNSSQNIITTGYGQFHLPTAEYYVNNSTFVVKIMSVYLDYMTSVFQILGAPNQTYTRESMFDVLEFKKKLARIVSTDATVTNLSAVTEQYKEINWLYLTNALLDGTNVTVSIEEPVRITAVDYLMKLNELLAVYKSTASGRKTLFNYLLWRLIYAFSNILSDDIRYLENPLNLLVYGNLLSQRTQLKCATETDALLGFATGALYVKENFPGKSKSVAKNMIETIRAAFIDSLNNMEWLDPDTRCLAIEKARAITSSIGYPDFILNSGQLEKFYHDFSVNESNYFKNRVEYEKFDLMNSMKILGSITKLEWPISPTSVNAYYRVLENSILFPAGILQPPFFSKNFPKSVNYGAIGATMAHEITHGFDNIGGQYDINGNRKQWWRLDTYGTFINKTQCFVDQYNHYQLNGEQLRGSQTLTENIADNGGVRIAYYAYKKWQEENEEDLPLPEIGLTHDQLYFLSFAQAKCENFSPEANHYLITSDMHAVFKYRVIGSLSNFEEFANVFKCSNTHLMNPGKKCKVW